MLKLVSNAPLPITRIYLVGKKVPVVELATYYAVYEVEGARYPPCRGHSVAAVDGRFIRCIPDDGEIKGEIKQRHSDQQKYRQTYRQTDRQSYSHTDRQTYRQM